ncbi:MAG: phycobilisome rod-core linker polypeptide [Leptolyngbyaceae bacterium]|nr:phycobilisome rod-core linker polypeptide [Leptolyngbyaceae bacterium]
MPIPLLTYAPSSQNQRVIGYEVPGDEQPRLYSTDVRLDSSEIESVIQAAYRQIFHEQQMLVNHRVLSLESQLRLGQITVREFIRGLLLSDSFRRLNYDANNNYRFVEICIQRVLGRQVYGDREKLAWSIVIATKGLEGFIDALLNSEEYRDAFGDTIVPYQRRRVLPQRSQGDLPFERMARYGTDYRDKLPKPNLSALRSTHGADGIFTQFEDFDFDTFVERANWRVAAAVLTVGFGLVGVAVAIAALADAPL